MFVFRTCATHHDLEQLDLTMKSHLDHMPPLESGDAPWTEAEVRVREAMLSSEVDVPEGLEASVMASLDSPVSGTATRLSWTWGAAILVCGVLVWVNWGSLEPEVERGESRTPTMEAESTPMGESTETSVEYPVAKDDSETTVVSDVEVKSASAHSSSEEEMTSQPAPAPPLESMDGRAATQLETNAPTSSDLRQPGAAPRLERRPATLEVKQ